ncbi:MAG: SMC-Scp complex subunit ScpB [Acidimicrobiales bacterium]
MTDQPHRHHPGSDDASTAEARRAIEAVLMVADEPVDPHLLAQLVELPAPRVEQLCAELADEYEQGGRGFVLVRVAGGYRYQSHPDEAAYVERFVLDGQSARLSAAALETLAIVAYKQPVSRAQIAAIRGVGVDGVMRTLQQRGYIDEIGRDVGPGQAVLFGTSPTFLERLGLDSLADLPPLGDFVPGADVVEALEHGLRADPGHGRVSGASAADVLPATADTDLDSPDGHDTGSDARGSADPEPAGPDLADPEPDPASSGDAGDDA